MSGNEYSIIFNSIRFFILEFFIFYVLDRIILDIIFIHIQLNKIRCFNPFLVNQVSILLFSNMYCKILSIFVFKGTFVNRELTLKEISW